MPCARRLTRCRGPLMGVGQFLYGGGLMQFDDAVNRLRGCGYQLIMVQGEPLCVVFWPQDADGRRRQQTMNHEEVVGLAQSVTLPGDERRALVDIERTGIVAVLRSYKQGTTDEEAKLTVVLEVTGDRAVRSIPVDRLRDMQGREVLVSLIGVQLRFDVAAGRPGGTA